MNLPIDEARKNDEVISLADSQILRWIDEINGIVDADNRAKEVKMKIRQAKHGDNSAQNRKLIRKLYKELDEIQFKPDYMCLIIDKENDYYRACKGFSINGVKYKRLLGTNGGIKNSTIVFVSDRVVDELRRRIDNDRDQTKPLVTAKLEAYRALTCSASVQVSMPHGILVVNDAETEYSSDVIYLTDECDGEPIMEEKKNETIKMDATDGFGIMLPSLAARWSRELGLDYTVSGLNTRFSFEKGMVFTFDFIDFANKVAGNYLVKDAWGNEVDIRQVELILTTSMCKLWDSYDSCDDYIKKSISNGYSFGISKTCPKELESDRMLNYQFIQSYDLSDEEIDELIYPTVCDIKEAFGGDWRKAILYLKGSGINASNVDRLPDDYIKAAMIDNRILNDPYVRNSIYQLIRNRINQAKYGVLRVHGNYSVVSGDPYLLCQSIFGMKLTGLLGPGEIYNQYWVDIGATDLACFRAPMTCHNNIRLVHPVGRDDVRYWYRFLHTSTVFNSFDTATYALNGADFDGDLVMLTDNKVLVNGITPLPALMCAQRKAEKRISSEDDFIRSNIESFGNEIGQTTNWITSMFEVRSHFENGSKEYEMLTYRIQCGQLYQQNVIDKAKGIIAKPMPKEWVNRHEVNRIIDRKKRDLYRDIVADKKPYFMRYIYPSLMKQYNNYIKNTDRNALREFQMTISELKALPYEDLTDRQKEFLKFYDIKMPVGVGDCVMNKICRRFEELFDGYVGKQNASVDFDYRIMKSDAEYLYNQYNSIRNIMNEYMKKVSNYIVFADYERVDECDSYSTLTAMENEFRKECLMICPNSLSLCNILLDICYKKNSTKRFVWKICGEDIIRNLLANNNNEIRFPTLCEAGAISFNGNRFSIGVKMIEGLKEAI